MGIDDAHHDDMLPTKYSLLVTCECLDRTSTRTTTYVFQLPRSQRATEIGIPNQFAAPQKGSTTRD